MWHTRFGQQVDIVSVADDGLINIRHTNGTERKCVRSYLRFTPSETSQAIAKLNEEDISFDDYVTRFGAIVSAAPNPMLT
jgi:hypothetical protein